ncbi:MAG: alpha/beta hydrolase [Snowella sp.]|nr:alpha/beta hydrolase [Snowella sp.]
MIEPPGVERDSVVTSLGTMVYYSPQKAPWVEDNLDSTTEKPTLIFLHGFGGGSSAYEWSKVYPAFAFNYRVLAPDLLGWGRSDHPERNYQPQDYINTILEFIEKTCEQPPTVIASSLVGGLTLRAAIARPDQFKNLILTNPTGLSDFGEDYSKNLFAQIVGVPVIDKMIYSVGVANSTAIQGFLETKQFANPNLLYPEITEAYLESATQPNAEYAALSFVRGDLCFDLAKYIPQLTIPTAFMWGQKASFAGPDVGKRLAALNGTAIKLFQEIEDVGLTPQLELPAVTISLINKFLKYFQNVS